MKRKVLLAASILLLLLVPIIVYGTSVSTNLSITITGSTTGCTPAGSPCPVGVLPPAGFHFDLVYYDDFTKDTTLNTSLWGAGCTPSGTCDSGMLYFDSNGLNLQPTQAHSGATGRADRPR